MIHGTFFKVDNDSVQQKGQVLFRYLPVKPTKEKEKGQHHYPVYVVLTTHAIDFYYHGPDRHNNDAHGHVHVRILHLPLSLNLAVKDNLTARLSAAFAAPSPLSDKYECVAGKKLGNYSGLGCFSNGDTERNDEAENCHAIPLKRLVLDFLFDLEHSRVFDASPHIETIEVRLRENFFFSAIAAKAAYYYNRENYRGKCANENECELYGHNLIEAEVTWLNILRDGRATETFWHEGWFKQVEDEYHAVMFSGFNRDNWRKKVSLSNNDLKDKQNIRILRETIRWFLLRYDLYNGFKTVLQYKAQRKIWLVPLLLFSFIAFPMILHDLNPAENNNNLVSIGIYLLAGFIPLLVGFLLFLYRKMFLPIIGALLPRLMMATASSWLFFTTTEELWKSDFDIKLNEMSWVLLLLVPVVLFMAIEIRNQAPDIRPHALLQRITYVLGVGLVYSLLMGVFFINYTGEKILSRSGYLTVFYKSNMDKMKYTLPDSIKTRVGALSVGVLDSKDDLLASFNNESAQQKIKKSLKRIKYNNNLENPAFLTKLAYLDTTYNAIDDSLEDISWIKFCYSASQESLYKYLKCFSYSTSFGDFNLKYEVPIYCGLNKVTSEIDVFPGMLFFRTLFALFIGIFIQLIFEDKPITEPL